MTLHATETYMNVFSPTAQDDDSDDEMNSSTISNAESMGKTYFT